jgi:hypothetical protein
MIRFSRVPRAARSAPKPPTARQGPTFELSLRTRIFLGVLHAQNLGIESCSAVPEEPVTAVVLNGNPIASFLGLPPLPTLARLEMDDTQIEDFRGFPFLKGLDCISLKRTPVMSHPQARTALLIIGPPSLRIINGEVVAAFERKFAESYPPACAVMIRAGWMPTVPPPKNEELDAINRAFVEQRAAEPQRPVSPARKMPATVRSLARILDDEEEAQRIELCALEREIERASQG